MSFLCSLLFLLRKMILLIGLRLPKSGCSGHADCHDATQVVDIRDPSAIKLRCAPMNISQHLYQLLHP